MVRQTGGATLVRLLGFLLHSAMIRACGDMNGRSMAEASARHLHIMTD